MEKIRPDALAECGDPELDDREEVQPVTEMMILEYVRETKQLPMESARPFARWIQDEWYGFSEEGDVTVGDVISGALEHWCGGRVEPSVEEKRIRTRWAERFREMAKEDQAAGGLAEPRYQEILGFLADLIDPDEK